ncbi:hypothetical protein [Methylobacterium nodulans]|uniref:Uncharacterized protein n=1 Tax=Methylobacterium nodulans (strain LMG 21967 / CNCM I-2342 / ORS 2060) TaxID=460265 RepID=B8ISW1_METNO|nr:hypothetical protein [Methylobacterium nodulans]ACL60760.1 conserved hypothetical protein [Methylobacterium nodulans ORS 2060]
MRTASALFGVLVVAGSAAGEERALVLPHVEGERQGGIVGRAMACGAPEADTRRAAQAASERMRRAVGQAQWQDRFLPAFNDAVALASQLPEAACDRALAALSGLERGSTP